MPYFSLAQLEVDALEGRTRRMEWRRLNAKGAAYRDHCLVWRLFGGAPDRQGAELATASTTGDYPGEGIPDSREATFVFRRRDDGERDLVTGAHRPLSFYVVSQESPVAVPGLLRLTGTPKAYDPVLQVGERVRFDLRANPTMARPRPGGDPITGRRLRSVHDDVLMSVKHILWEKRGRRRAQTRQEFEEQADGMQAAALDWFTHRAGGWGLGVQPEHITSAGYTQHQMRRKGGQICFSSLDYTGLATVTDPPQLRTALLAGVGRKRGFGCGLLLVRRVDA